MAAGIFRALAADFDGTLTSGGRRPADDLLAALAQARADGTRVLIVTGRILSELEADFPDVTDHVDLIVAENGAVMHGPSGRRLLAPPVDGALADRLREIGVPVRTGESLIACDGHHAMTVLATIRELGLDAQLVHNRDALMVLPAGVTKGTGLFEALGDLGVSHHSTIGVGDAENDHSLLDVCEVGAAVGDAVPALRRHADIVLAGPNADGVRELLAGPVMDGRQPVHSRRWRLQLGVGPDGRPIGVPASQLDLLVCGRPGAGKSFAAGLIAERLISMGYCVLVVDPEGDHDSLGRLRGAQVIDAAEGLPSPDRLADRFRHRFSSLVLDLSCLPDDEQHAYLEALAPAIARTRAEVGLPHWMVLDEAHGMPRSLTRRSDHTFRGRVLATFRPGDLADDVLDGLDGVLVLHDGAPPATDVMRLAERVSGTPATTLAGLASGLREHQALLALRPRVGRTTTLTLAERATPQIRHEHKYVTTLLEPERAFWFRDDDDEVVDRARSIAEMRAVLATSGDGVLLHHAPGNDLSRWVGAVFRDPVLAEALAAAEDDLWQGGIAPAEARTRMLAAVAMRYPP